MTALVGPYAVLAVAWDAARIAAVVAMVVSLPFLALAVVACRRPAPVRPGRELLQLAITVAAVASMAFLVQVQVGAAMALAAVGAGALIGLVQGWTVRALSDGGQLRVRRSALGTAAFSVGLLVAQGAGVGASVGVLQLGQTVSLFGVGVLTGALIGRQARLGGGQARATDPREGGAVPSTTGVAVITVLVVWLVSAIGLGTVALAQAPDGDGATWRLEEVTIEPPVSPAGSVTTSSQGFVSVEFLDDPTVSMTVTYDPPLSTLEPGVTYDIPVTVTGEVTGGTDTQGYRFVTVLLWQNDSPSPGAGEIYVELGCTTQIGTWETTCSPPVTIRDELTFVAPSSSGDGTYRLSVFVYGRAWAHFDYQLQAAPATVDPPEADAPRSDPPEADAPETDAPGAAPPVDSVDPEGADPEALPPPTASLPPPLTPPDAISSQQAVGQAVVGLVAAAGLAATSLGGLTSSASGAGSAPSGGQASGRVRTVVLSGADAEAVLQGGSGTTVDIPPDQQWGVNAAIEGGPTMLEDRYGAQGIVRSVGPVVRAEDGSVAVSVEVDAFDPPAQTPAQTPTPAQTSPAPPQPSVPQIPPVTTSSPPPSPPPTPPQPSPARYSDAEIWDAVDRWMDYHSGGRRGVDGPRQTTPPRPPASTPPRPPASTPPRPPAPNVAPPSAPDRYSDEQIWEAIGHGGGQVMEATTPPPAPPESPPASHGPGRHPRGAGDRSEPEVHAPFGAEPGYEGSGKDAATGPAG
jgi:hypothetical protein